MKHKKDCFEKSIEKKINSALIKVKTKPSNLSIKPKSGKGL